MKQSRLLNNIVGGSYEADVRIAGNAVSMNLYPESVEDVGGGMYCVSSLRSVEGERLVLDLSKLPGIDVQDPSGQGCRGLFTASDDTLFAAYGKGILRIRRNAANGTYSCETIHTQRTETIGEVMFAETGGVNSWVCWIDGSEFVKAYPLEPDKVTGESLPAEFRTPIRVYLTADDIRKDKETHVRPTSIRCMAGSVVINDPENDTWYFTDAYVLGGSTLTRSVYELDSEGNVQYEEGSSYKVKTKTVDLRSEDNESMTAYLWLDRYSKPRWKTAEYAADSVTSFARAGDFLFAIGTKSVQAYTQTTSTDSQGYTSMEFTSSGRNFRDIGSNSPGTVTEVNGHVSFLGSGARGERSVWSTAGGEPVRISTNAIERELQGADTSDAYAFGYVGNGHQFYVLTVPAIRKTFCFDFATKQWHNRSTRDKEGRDVEWWARHSADIGGETVIAGMGVPVLAALDRDKFDNYMGEPIIKRRTAPILLDDFAPFMLNDVQLLWNTGTSTDYDNSRGAREPVVMLDVSTDGGNTFGSERWATGGKVGQYGHRSVWYGIGMGTLFVLRFTISDRVNVVITGAKVSYTRCAHF